MASAAAATTSAAAASETSASITAPRVVGTRTVIAVGRAVVLVCIRIIGAVIVPVGSCVIGSPVVVRRIAAAGIIATAIGAVSATVDRIAAPVSGGSRSAVITVGMRITAILDRSLIRAVIVCATVVHAI